MNKIFSKIRTAIALSPSTRTKLIRAQLQSFGKTGLNRCSAPIAAAFHCAYYDAPDSWMQNSWMGKTIWQLPSDLHTYQEIIYQTQPDFIVQTGVAHGGSALFFAQMLDLIGAPETAKVVGVDIELTPSARALTHPRIHLIEGSSTAPEILVQIEQIVAGIAVENGGMVSLDSDHSARHVTRELSLYSQFVGVGNYLVVEDTNVNGHPVFRAHGAGPCEAMKPFLTRNKCFRDTDAASRQMLSFHSWLRRV